MKEGRRKKGKEKGRRKRKEMRDWKRIYKAGKREEEAWRSGEKRKRRKGKGG